MKIDLKKNDIVDLYIEDLLPDGNGVGKYNGFVIFVPRTCVGDKIKARIIKMGVSRAYGKVEEIIEPSLDRIPLDCPVFKSCGGCVYRHLSYEKEKQIKQNIVEQNFKRIGGFNIKSESIISPTLNRYRNKAEYPCALIGGKVRFGFYARGSHRVVPNYDCMLQPEYFADIIKIVEDFCNEYKIEPYNEETKTGLLRHLYIRASEQTKDIMVCLVVTGEKVPDIELLCKRLTKCNSNICSIILDINQKDSNKILSDKYIVVYGKEYIEDILCGLSFKINPLSFFQVNHDCTEYLYSLAKEFASLTGEELLLDLYCGTGTIGLSMANKVKSLIGVEINENAVKDAKENAKNNNITNASFICSDAGKAANDLFLNNIHPDVVIVDPPRSGCDDLTIESILKMNPNRIVMISCNSSTAARDCRKIVDSNNYELIKYNPVDMFPRTGHVETVCLLTKK